MDMIRKSEWAQLGGHALVLLMGAYFIWQRDQALVQMVILLALCLAAAGVAGLLRWVFAKPRPDPMFLAGPVFLLVAALVIYLLRVQITGVTPVLIGILSLGAGIVQCFSVLRTAHLRLPWWWLHLPTAALWLLFGILVLTGAINLNAVFMLVVGIFLAVFGVLGVAESIAALCMRR